MFDTPAAARLALQKHFAKPQVEMIVEALVPAIGFVPRPGAVLGGTRIGGTPDLPPGLDWPRRARPADAEAIATRGSKKAGEAMAAHFRLELPYAFLAQINLREAAALGSMAEALPNEGRLLVFYDLVTGPYDTGTETVRVIWDRAPRETLVPQALPPALEAAAQEERRATRAAYAAAGMKPPSENGRGSSTAYESPARSMSLTARLRLPGVHAGDMDDRPALKALWEAERFGQNPFREAYQDLDARFFDYHYGAANPGHRHQLLGSSDPEQDDPRYDAVVTTRYGVQHLDSDTRKADFSEIQAETRSWRLLLQIDLSDHAQDDIVEGTVYILIRDADLKARRFERAVAVYQQT